MKRFASLATTTALAGSLIGAGTAAQAASTMSLVPVSSITGTYKAGDIINVAVVLSLGTGSFGTFTCPTAVGYVNSQFDDPDPGAGIQPAGNGMAGYGPDTTSRFSGPNAAGTTSLYGMWTLNTPDVNASTATTLNGETLQSAQAVPGHANTTATIGGAKTTLAVPAGTYTLATFAFAVASTYKSGPLTLLLPTAFGYSNAVNNTDGAYVAGSGPSMLINGKAPSGGTPIAEPLSFPTAGAKLTFNAPATGGATPAPSSLIVVAMGAVPAIGVLRRRRAAK